MDYPLWKNSNFTFFVHTCFYGLYRFLFYLERQQTLFLDLFLIKRKDEKISTNPFQKCQFCGFLKPMFLLFRKACLLDKTSQIVFSRFIFTIYDMGIQGVIRGYKELQGVTRGYKG